MQLSSGVRTGSASRSIRSDDSNPLPTSVPPRDAWVRRGALLHRRDSEGRLAIKIALIFLFLRFSYLHELTYVILDMRYLLYAAGIPAVIVLVVGGGLRRAFANRYVRYWIASVLGLDDCMRAIQLLADGFPGGSCRLRESAPAGDTANGWSP